MIPRIIANLDWYTRRDAWPGVVWNVMFWKGRYYGRWPHVWMIEGEGDHHYIVHGKLQGVWDNERRDPVNVEMDNGVVRKINMRELHQRRDAAEHMAKILNFSYVRVSAMNLERVAYEVCEALREYEKIRVGKGNMLNVVFRRSDGFLGVNLATKFAIEGILFNQGRGIGTNIDFCSPTEGLLLMSITLHTFSDLIREYAEGVQGETLVIGEDCKAHGGLVGTHLQASKITLMVALPPLSDYVHDMIGMPGKGALPVRAFTGSPLHPPGGKNLIIPGATPHDIVEELFGYMWTN